MPSAPPTRIRSCPGYYHSNKPRHRCDIADAQHRAILVIGFSREGDHGILGIFEVDPVEPRSIGIKIGDRPCRSDV